LTTFWVSRSTPLPLISYIIEKLLISSDFPDWSCSLLQNLITIDYQMLLYHHQLSNASGSKKIAPAYLQASGSKSAKAAAGFVVCVFFPSHF
jgi:hypothetical protein